MPNAPSLALDDVAILLDVDGTILDLAPTPQAVVAPPDLCQALVRLCRRTGGALAFVSGRPLSDLDRIFAPLRLPAIGGHGAELRVAAGDAPVQSRISEIDPELRRRFAAIAASDPGILVEDKGYSLAVHYRLAPEKEGMIRKSVAAICADFAGDGIELLPGKSVIEIKQAGFNKGSAVRELMTLHPFRGRQPVFLGDDVTDHEVFALMPSLGGIAISVGERHPGVDYSFERPAQVRRWLEDLSETDALAAHD
jgi:trehalose 6-phosphate phosphatase